MSRSRTFLDKASRLRVTQVQSYLGQRGWTHRPIRDNAIALEGPADDAGEPLVWQFPAHEGFVDYTQCVERLVAALAALEGRSATEIVDDMLAQPTGTSPAAAAS